MNIRPIIFSLLILFSITAFSQKIALERVEPPFWWTGMKHNHLQLLVYGQNLSETRPEISYLGVTLKSYAKVESPNYMFINLEISSNAMPGSFDIRFMDGRKKAAEYSYNLLEREAGSAARKGFDESDVIYLIFPDRFVNGDPDNDSHPEMLEAADLSNPDGRHGGDLAGVMQKLDYFQELGVSAIWLNPILENNQAAYSYHGYAISDFYRVDPRMGSNEDFKNLNANLKDRGMKSIMDMVFNHCGSGHWWMDDLPSQDWINQWPEYTKSNFRGGVVFDPYASDYDRDIFQKGWFDTNMPDLNQRNPFMNEYLIQNSIWWIEYAGLDGIRMDTYPYPFKEQMAEWAERVMTEYPDFSIVGEAWMGQAAHVAPWESKPGIETGYNSHLPYVFDFPMYDAYAAAFNENDGWGFGIIRLYDILTQDFLYGEEAKVVTFADNHDGNRIFTKVNESKKNQKLAMTFLLTSRGVPQIYYGTEILMAGDGKNGHGEMRKFFPGGKPGDRVNKFEASGRTADENEMFDFLTNLIKWRNKNEVIHHGKLKHFIPENNMYVYFRYNDEKLVMVILNNHTEAQIFDTDRFSEITGSINSGRNVLDGKNYTLSGLEIPAKESMVLELK